MNAPPQVRSVRAAFVFLTRIPVGGAYSDRDWAWSSAHFPLVGAVLGFALGALDDALAVPLGPLVAALVTLAVSMLVTGGFHEDGLADTADALGGGADRDRVLAILKDSRVGAFGASALVLSIALRAALLARLGGEAWCSLPLVWCAARVGPVALLAALPYVSARESGASAKSNDVAGADKPQAFVAGAWFVALAVTTIWMRWVAFERLIALAVVMAITAFITGWHYVRRVGGVTGDFLGATEQISEVFGLIVLAWGVG